MKNKGEIGQQAANDAGKGPQGAQKDKKDPGKPHPNPHLEHQDRHGSGEGETGLQPGAGHPRGR